MTRCALTPHPKAPAKQADVVVGAPLEASLQPVLQAEAMLEFAVLIGSRALGMASSASDWDIALQWTRNQDWMMTLARTETLRRQLAKALGVNEAAIDLIDLTRNIGVIGVRPQLPVRQLPAGERVP